MERVHFTVFIVESRVSPTITREKRPPGGFRENKLQ